MRTQTIRKRKRMEGEGQGRVMKEGKGGEIGEVV